MVIESVSMNGAVHARSLVTGKSTVISVDRLHSRAYKCVAA